MIKGKIIRGIAGFYYVHIVESGIYECKAKGKFRIDKIKPLVGDNVNIEVTDEINKKGNIAEILTRKNELIRPAVANIDQAAVVFSVVKPKPHYNLLDRFLTMMEYKGIPVILCFNKLDLAEEKQVKEIECIYKTSFHKIIFISAKEKQNMLKLKELLNGKTTVFAGPSGVGKSSITNELQMVVSMPTGSISQKIERGKHTTRHSELIRIDEHSYLVDTPGFSSFYASEFEEGELKYYITEFRKYEGLCKYQGCNHIHEPECAVKEAVKQGKIHEIRYKNYLEMYQDLQTNKKVRR